MRTTQFPRTIRTPSWVLALGLIVGTTVPQNSWGRGVEDSPGKVVNLVGTGKPGNSGEGGDARKAQIEGPFDVRYDRAGNLYFSDTSNHAVKKRDAKTGVLVTVAGNGTKGFSGDGGPALRAQFSEPYGVAIDRRGNLFVADRLNARVRRVDAATGIITTLAGTGTKGSAGDGGPAARAQLVEPNGVALDPEEKRLFIADVTGHKIRAVRLSDGVISTFAGTGKSAHTGDGGPAIAASIHGARATRVGRDGTVYILEREGNSLRAVDPVTGVIRRIAGTGNAGYLGDGGPALFATFRGPKELDLDPNGVIAIVDTENHAIRLIDPVTGIIRTAVGNGRAGKDQQLDRPHGVTFAPDGALIIGDTNNHRIAQSPVPNVAPAP